MLNIYQPSEEQLIKDCIQGDSKAQKRLFELFSGKMLGVCLRFISEFETAEDIMIGGFIKVYDKLNQFNFEGSFEGWIRKIMVNESLTYIRKNKHMYLQVDIEAADREPDFNQLGNHLEAEDLLKMIQKLPTGYRTVFNLYAIEGFSHKEIAEQLDISENTSKSQLSRARVLLKKNLLDSERILNASIHLS
ncbi:MAG: sigma-70 family RNA polymerase sigma factor [Cyclobacteriaceae bacterium]|nr:sigma-70 family RNA polymerase sigma factor [Cyclobacteriaceae bacterium]